MTRITALAFTGLLVLACSTTAPAQDTERELRRENEALRSQVTDLQAELEALKQENERLRAEIQRLRAALQAGAGAGTATPPADQPPVTIDETVPDASPRALKNALKASYDDEMTDAEIGYADSQERRLYLRQVERWHTRAAREFRSQIEWHVKVQNADEDLSNGSLTVVAVDPVSGAVLGDPFTIAVPRSSIRPLELLQSRRELDVLVLKGVLQPQLSVDPAMEEPGAFDQQKFLAPFVSFTFTINVQSLTPPEPADDDGGG